MSIGHAIGVDIGGTKIAAGLVDLANGAIIGRRQVSTDKSGGGTKALADAAALAAALLTEAKERGIAVRGIGVGVPELVDHDGIVRSRYNFEWSGLSLSRHFADVAAGAPVVIESDVRAAARGEMLYGAGRGRRVCVYVTVGTGVSYCLCVDGVPFRGAHGYAIHFASSPLSMRCQACSSLQAPVVEEISSGPGLTRAYAKAAGVSVAGAEAVLAAAEAGDAAAMRIVDDAAHLLGASIGLVINMLDPEAVVIGGGLGTAEGIYFPKVVAETRAHIFAEDCRSLPIVRATLGPDAGMIGAAAYAA